jgi:hypothetical protein
MTKNTDADSVLSYDDIDSSHFLDDANLNDGTNGCQLGVLRRHGVADLDPTAADLAVAAEEGDGSSSVD